VQVASQHAKAIRQRARISVKERLLLNGIALHAAHISPGHVESATLVVAHLADTGLAIGNRTAMATGVTTHAIAVELLVEFTFADVLVNNVA
jgi:hypothetical protein